jgi:hypothetical protein
MIIHTIPAHLAHIAEALQTRLASARRILKNNEVVMLATERSPGRYKIGAILRPEMVVYLAAWEEQDMLAKAPYGKAFGVIVPRDGCDLYMIALSDEVMLS